MCEIRGFPLQVLKGKGEKKRPSRTGFEPVRGNPIGFRVQRLNHSATVTPKTAAGLALTEGVRPAGTPARRPRAPSPLLTSLLCRSKGNIGGTGGPGWEGHPPSEDSGCQGAQRSVGGDGVACEGSSWRAGAGPEGGGPGTPGWRRERRWDGA